MAISQIAQSTKTKFIISQFPVIVFLTLGIFPLVMSIILIIKKDKFINNGFALATGILGIIFSGFLFPFILGFFLQPCIIKKQSIDQNNGNNLNVVLNESNSSNQYSNF